MDFDEHIDPLDPRFVDAVLARAQRRAANVVQAEPEAAPPATAPSPSAEAVSRSAPVVPAAREPATYTPVNEPVAFEPAVNKPVAYEPAGFDHQDQPVESSFVDESHVEVADQLASADDQQDDDEPEEWVESRRARSVVEWVAVAVAAVVVAFIIRAFLLQAFYIPSESMEPALYENDRILVNKLSYKLHDVNRGDLIVFEKPANEPAAGIHDLIKRSIALSGETIELHPDGTIIIDGQLLNEPYLAEGQLPGQMTMARASFAEGACTNPATETTRCTVADGHVWVMGDNRDHSHDSRAFGPIDEDLIVGRAFLKVWPLSKIGFL